MPTLGKKGEINAIDDADLGRFDDDSVDQGSENFAACCPVGLRQIGADRFAEAVHARQRFTQGGLFARLGGECFQSRIHVSEALAGPRKTRLEFLSVDQAIGVDIDHALQRALRGGELPAQRAFRL